MGVAFGVAVAVATGVGVAVGVAVAVVTGVGVAVGVAVAVVAGVGMVVGVAVTKGVAVAVNEGVGDGVSGTAVFGAMAIPIIKTTATIIPLSIFLSGNTLLTIFSTGAIGRRPIPKSANNMPVKLNPYTKHPLNMSAENTHLVIFNTSFLFFILILSSPKPIIYNHYFNHRNRVGKHRNLSEIAFCLSLGYYYPYIIQD